jgi:DNA-binding PadR family transcriptional regulator
MAGRRRINNLLALAVLGLLVETPMHPYEMGITLRERHKDSSFKISTGTLYDVVEALAREGWIAAGETVREGRRPERTVYALTDEGREQFARWLDELLRVPTKEYPRFLAAISYLGALTPGNAIDALETRAANLQERIIETREIHQQIIQQGMPEIFVIEIDYSLDMIEAEFRWVQRTIDKIKSGGLRLPQPVGADDDAGVSTGSAGS